MFLSLILLLALAAAVTIYIRPNPNQTLPERPRHSRYDLSLGAPESDWELFKLKYYSV